MSANTSKQSKKKTEAELEAEDIKWCEKLSRKLDTKHSKTKRRGYCENSRR